MNKSIEFITRLQPEELEWWRSTIVKFRREYIKDPKSYAEKIIQEEKITRDTLKISLEKHLEVIREKVWGLYLIDEAEFHRNVLAHLMLVRDLPRSILQNVIEEYSLFELDLKNMDREEAYKTIAKLVGDTSGRIFPYLYELSLSTTQSRRSRSGKVFERIIETFFEIFEYPYNNQSSIGNAGYDTVGLGKKVDLIVPDVEKYLDERSKCAVVTMKTSLRERWQEVAEELQRTNVPHIYLLTVDKTVTSNTINVMKRYNITLVLYKTTKEDKLKEFTNVKSFEEFFLHEIPHILSYWK